MSLGKETQMFKKEEGIDENVEKWSQKKSKLEKQYLFSLLKVKSQYHLDKEMQKHVMRIH